MTDIRLIVTDRGDIPHAYYIITLAEALTEGYRRSYRIDI